MLLVGELSHRRAGSSTASAEYFRIYYECGTNGTFTAPFMCRDQSPHQPVLLPAMQHPGNFLLHPRELHQGASPSTNLPCQAHISHHIHGCKPSTGHQKQGQHTQHRLHRTSQPGKGLGLHSHPWKRSQTPAAQMPVVQGILSPIFGDTRTLILTRPFAELPVNLSCLKLKFCDLFIFVKLWDTTAEHANIA